MPSGRKKLVSSPHAADLADMLKRIADLAAEIITLTALESSGIRDGDGYWHGSDPLDGCIRDIYGLWTTFDHCSNSFGQGHKPEPFPHKGLASGNVLSS